LAYSGEGNVELSEQHTVEHWKRGKKKNKTFWEELIYFLLI
jgi:hypothetical protein